MSPEKRLYDQMSQPVLKRQFDYYPMQHNLSTGMFCVYVVSQMVPMGVLMTLKLSQDLEEKWIIRTSLIRYVLIA